MACYGIATGVRRTTTFGSKATPRGEGTVTHGLGAEPMRYPKVITDRPTNSASSASGKYPRCSLRMRTPIRGKLPPSISIVPPNGVPRDATTRPHTMRCSSPKRDSDASPASSTKSAAGVHGPPGRAASNGSASFTAASRKPESERGSSLPIGSSFPSVVDRRLVVPTTESSGLRRPAGPVLRPSSSTRTLHRDARGPCFAR